MLPVGSEPFFRGAERDVQLALFKEEFFSKVKSVPREELDSLPKLLEAIFDIGGRIFEHMYAVNGDQKWPCIKSLVLPYADFVAVDEPRSIKKYLIDQLVYFNTASRTDTEIGEAEIRQLFARLSLFS